MEYRDISPRVNEEGSWILDDDDNNSVLGFLHHVIVSNVLKGHAPLVFRALRV